MSKRTINQALWLLILIICTACSEVSVIILPDEVDEIARTFIESIRSDEIGIAIEMMRPDIDIVKIERTLRSLVEPLNVGQMIETSPLVYQVSKKQMFSGEKFNTHQIDYYVLYTDADPSKYQEMESAYFSIKPERGGKAHQFIQLSVHEERGRLYIQDILIKAIPNKPNPHRKYYPWR